MLKNAFPEFMASHRPRSAVMPTGSDGISLVRRLPWWPVLRVSAISSLAGLALIFQDAIVAAYFAASEEADAYQLAMSFPLVALNVLAGGTLLAVIVPRLIQLELGGHADMAAALVRHTRKRVALVLLVACALWAGCYPLVIRSIADDFSPATIDLSIQLLWMGLPVLLLLGLSGVEAAVLNARRRFGLLSALPAFLPVGVAAGVLLLGVRFGIFSALIGALAGSLAQWVTTRWSTAALMSRAAQTNEPSGFPGLAGAYGFAAGAAALLGAIPMTDTFVASTLPPGSAATFGYASRPIALLLAFATTIFGNVTLPAFSRLAAAGELPKLRARFLTLCGCIVLATVPVVIVVHRYATHLVKFLYERGTFGPLDTVNVATVQETYVLHLPLFAIGAMAWRVLNSLQHYGAPLVITAFAFALNLYADLRLAPLHGLVGVAWGTNAAFALWTVLLILYLGAVTGTRTAPRETVR